MPFAPRELLILSDLHLGKDCKEITGFAQPRPDAAFDRAFVDLLDVYTSGREKDWRLILGGDFIDFMEVVVAPGASSRLDIKLTFEVTDEEKEFGLGSEAERAIVKLDRTFEYHADFFARLAKFLRAGGEVVIVRGNHDVEFYWKKVQKFFRRKMTELAIAGEGLDVDQVIEVGGELQERLQFLPWIYFEPGRIYFEHGNQYDEYCSFSHWLHPVSPQNPRRIDTPLSAFAMRYFVNMMTDYAANDVEVWGVKDYLRWLRQKGVGGSIYAVKMAFGATARLLVYAVEWTFGRVGRYSQEHQKKLAEEAQRFSLPEEKLAAVGRLHHTPVSRNLAELLRLLYLDRLLILGGAMLLALVVLVSFHSPGAELAGLLVVAFLAHRVNAALEPRRFLLPGPKQISVAKRITEIVDTPLVVMGHSHLRRDVDLGGGKRYVNTGCWLPPLEGKEHVDASQPCTCKLSHLVVDRQGKAELRVFCKAARTVRIADVAEAPQPGDPARARLERGQVILAELSEAEVIALFTDGATPPFPEVIVDNGDDCAVYRARPGLAEVITTDGLVEGVHFELDTTEPRLVGRKLMSVNLSDLAAMGAEPRYALIAACLPRELEVEVAREIARGARERAVEHGVHLIGGNVTRSPRGVVLQATLVGELEPARVMRRKGAARGDRLLVSGELGAARLGLLSARRPELGAARLRAMRALNDPTPRVGLGLRLAATGLVRACCDVSDGLARDLGRMLDGLGAELDVEALPIDAELRALAAALGTDGGSVALEGGEDYELLIAVAPEDVRAVQEAAHEPLTVIGEVGGEGLRRRGGGAVGGGFEHFERRAVRAGIC